MLEILFSISFFLFGGNIIDTKLAHHKYEKENYKEIFYLKTKESVNTYCIKHSELENIKKIKYHRPNGGQETNYKITKSIDNETKKEYYDNGQIKSVEYYKDGKKEGLWIRYFYNGNLSIKGNFKDNKQEGYWMSYYDNGQLYLDRIYKDGKLEGIWKSFYKNGQLNYEWNYKEGELISQKCWDENGNKIECE